MDLRQLISKMAELDSVAEGMDDPAEFDAEKAAVRKRIEALKAAKEEGGDDWFSDMDDKGPRVKRKGGRYGSEYDSGDDDYMAEEDMQAKLRAVGSKYDGEIDILMAYDHGGPFGEYVQQVYDDMANKMGVDMDSGDPDDFDKVHLAVMKSIGVDAVPLDDLIRQGDERETNAALSDPDLTGEAVDDYDRMRDAKADEKDPGVAGYEDDPFGVKWRAEREAQGKSTTSPRDVNSSEYDDFESVVRDYTSDLEERGVYGDLTDKELRAAFRLFKTGAHGQAAEEILSVFSDQDGGEANLDGIYTDLIADFHHLGQTGSEPVDKKGVPTDADDKMKEDQVDECGMEMAPPMGSKEQPDNVSMNVSMNGSGDDGVADLLKVLAGVINKDAMSGNDKAAPDTLIPKSITPKDIDRMGMALDDDFANTPDEEYGDVSMMTRTGDDLHSKGDEAPAVNGGGNPFKAQLEALYNEIKNR